MCCLRGKTVTILVCRAKVPGSIADPEDIFVWPLLIIILLALFIVCLILATDQLIVHSLNIYHKSFKITLY